MDRIKRNYYILTGISILCAVGLFFEGIGIIQALSFMFTLLCIAFDPLFSNNEKNYPSYIYYINKLVPFIILLVYGSKFINNVEPVQTGTDVIMMWGVYVLISLYILFIRYVGIKRDSK